MEHQSPVAHSFDRLITDAPSDPRPPQAIFLLPIGALVVVLGVIDPGFMLRPVFSAGMTLVAVASAAALLVPWRRLPPWAVMAVPLTDLVALGLLRTLPSSGAIAALLVIPAIWLGMVFGRKGVVTATLATVLILAVPGVYTYGLSLDGWSRAVLHPIIAFVASYSMHMTSAAWSRQREELRRQGRELERLLREVTQHRQLTEAIVRSVDVGLLAIGRDGGYNSMNPRHAEFLKIAYPDGHGGEAGQTGDAFAADGTTVLDHEDLPSTRAARGETFSDYTIWVGRDPANRRALAVSSRPMFDETGAFDGAVLAYKDVTELMQALEVKDEFVASVSHELRTPLTSIIGYVDLVTERQEQIPDEVNRHLGVVRRNAERLHLLVSDLLSIAQAQAVGLRLETEPVDLSVLVRQGLAVAEKRAGGAGVRLVDEVAVAPPVTADPHRMAQVVDNLLSNAVKYTPRGGTVTVSVTAEERDVVLTVRDDGFGMSAQELDKLFTRFYRARGAQERAIPGVGLGLAITKSVVDAHAGTIDITSAEGEGTVVRVALPRADIPAASGGE